MSTKQFAGFIGAGFIGACLMTAMGATKPGGAVVPRYSVQNMPAVMYITDNETNKHYVYENVSNKGTFLRVTMDLSTTGENELKVVKP